MQKISTPINICFKCTQIAEFFVCLRKSGRSLEEHNDDVRFRRK